MTSISDTKEGFQRLKKALLEIDAIVEKGKIRVPNLNLSYKKRMNIFEAKVGEETKISLTDCMGKVSSTMVCLYPPGAPIIVPGEEITEEAIEIIKEAMAKGLHVTGIDNKTIFVVN